MRSSSPKPKPESKSTKSQSFFSKDKAPESAFFSKESVQRQEAPFFKGGDSSQSSSDHGLPAQLQNGVEQLSGQDMSDVNVHYNSDKPADLQAHAFAKGADIHLAPGQEKHLPHEAWHVAQQKQGRVKPTTQLKGEEINDDSALEKEADEMGAKAMGLDKGQTENIVPSKEVTISSQPTQRIIQRAGFDDPEWDKVASVKAIEATNGGVLVVTFINKEVFVIKSADQAAPGREVLAGNLASLASLPAPKIRTAALEEQGKILGIPEVKPHFGKVIKSVPIIVMEKVDGYDLGKLNKNERVLSPPDLLEIAEQMGNWLAFDMLISEIDRFHEIGKPNFNLNAGNLIIDPKANMISGVDQTASFMSSATMEDDGSKTFEAKKRMAFEKIKALSKAMAQTMANDILKRLVPDSTNFEKLPEGFDMTFGIALLKAANIQFAKMAAIAPEKIDEVANDSIKPIEQDSAYKEAVVAIKKNLAFLKK